MDVWKKLYRYPKLWKACESTAIRERKGGESEGMERQRKKETGGERERVRE